MAIVVNSSVPLVVAQGVTANIALQTGTLINARVLQILGNDQAQISIAGQSIDVQSQVPLQAGQTLQLAVSQGADGSVRLAVVNSQGSSPANTSASQGATGAATTETISDTLTLAPEAAASLAAQSTSNVNAPVNQLTALEAIAVSGAAQNAALQQASLGPLFANLQVAAGLDNLPPQVQQAVAQLLSQRTSLDPNLSGEDIKQAFQSSGLFLEASLASGSASLSSTTPDLKGALIVLRQVLTTSLGEAQVSTPATTTPTASPTSTTTSGATIPATTLVTTLAAASAGTAAVTSGSALEAAVLAQNAQPGSQVLTQPITIIADPTVPTTISPTLAPLLASETTASETSTPNTVLQEVIDFTAANSILTAATTPTDAAARTAASSAALNLLQEVIQANPLTAANLAQTSFENSRFVSLLPVPVARLSNADNPGVARGKGAPPPIGGALPAAQPVAGATIGSNSSLENAIHRLLDDTDGAIARQTLLQIASLPDRADAAGAKVDPTIQRWNFEIPFATPQGTAMAQFEISRDADGQNESLSRRVWRARFSIDVEPTGPIHALISLNGDKTSVRMWAERPATADQLRAGTVQLTQALSQADLQPGDIVIRDGAPPQSASAPAGHFLDRAL